MYIYLCMAIHNLRILYEGKQFCPLYKCTNPVIPVFIRIFFIKLNFYLAYYKLNLKKIPDFS